MGDENGGAMIRTYHCAECGNQLQGRGTGLKTFTCPQHPRRFETVVRDLSGGKEQNRGERQTPVTVKRHTLVEVRYAS